MPRAEVTCMLELVKTGGQELDGKKQDAMAEDARIAQLCEGQARIVSMLLAQQAEISRLAQALSTVRISRTQELALQAAVRRRAAQLATQEGLPAAAAPRIANAIRVTLRETTGVRAAGDLQAAQFDRAMGIVTGWRMDGALRRIRRETAKGDDHDAR